MATPVARLAGVDNTGTAGGDENAVKLQALVYVLDPNTFAALTRQ
jgi:hypothetical protein